MESEADHDGRRPALSRLRAILAILACTVVSVWLLVAALRASPEPLIPPLFVAFSVCLVRGVTVAARWVAMGPGQTSDRVIWSLFVVAMLTLAPFAAFRPGEIFGVALLLPYFGVQAIYWRFARFIGEREEMEDRETDARLGIEHALLALALFCVVVASARMCIDWRDFRFRPEVVTVLLLAGSVLPVAGLIPLFCDLGMRAAIRSRSSRDRRIGTMIVMIPTVIAIVSLLVVSIASQNEFVVSTFGFIVSYFIYSALQEIVLAASGFVATVDPAPSGDGAGRTSKSTSEERRSGHTT